MDPLETLKSYLLLCAAWYEQREQRGPQATVDAHRAIHRIHEDVTRQIEDLLDWMKKGGDPPDVRRINRR